MCEAMPVRRLYGSDARLLHSYQLATCILQTHRRIRERRTRMVLALLSPDRRRRTQSAEAVRRAPVVGKPFVLPKATRSLW
jgi:hypothetical protein